VNSMRADDARQGFFRVRPLEEVLSDLDDTEPVETEQTSLGGALGRVTACGIPSPEDVPHFDRATMDGYAVRAADVAGANESYGVRLQVIGTVLMGSEPVCTVGAGETVEVGTGGMLPPGADAVVMVEYTESERGGDAVRVYRPVLPGENIMAVGADWGRGEEVVSAGTVLRAAHIAALASCGISSVCVRRAPRVGVIATGDELVPSGRPVASGQVRDSSSVALTAALDRDGALGNLVGIVPDDQDSIRGAVKTALADNDMVLVLAGSSVGRRDLTLDAIRAAGRCEVIATGIDMRPGKPTIVTRVDGVLVLGLPGHPVSSLIAYEMVVRPVVWRLLGVRQEERTLLRSQVLARLAANVASLAGRTSFVRVQLEQRDGQTWAYPLPSVSGAVSTLAAAHGWLVVPGGQEGFERDTVVTVVLVP